VSKEDKSLVIVRADWIRGGKNLPRHEGHSVLRSQEGKMCCLGFLGLTCGYSATELLGHVTPADTGLIDDDTGECDVPKWPAELLENKTDAHRYPQNSLLCSEIMAVNDGEASSCEPKREGELTELFGRMGWKVEFR
jgi:hypothetical protein